MNDSGIKGFDSDKAGVSFTSANLMPTGSIAQRALLRNLVEEVLAEKQASEYDWSSKKRNSQPLN